MRYIISVNSAFLKLIECNILSYHLLILIITIMIFYPKFVIVNQSLHIL